MRFLTSGSAPLHVDTAMTFLGMGVPIMQGYGLTETSPVMSVSRPGANEYGAVGRPISGVDGTHRRGRRGAGRAGATSCRATIAIARRRPQRSRADGYTPATSARSMRPAILRITDRKNEIFKTGTGKWISPARIEANIKRSIFVAQAMVTGRGMPYPIALICPNWPLVRLELPQLPPTRRNETLAARDDVRAFLTHEVRRQTHGLATYEQVRRIVVVPREFTVEGGELSPSMKIKRRTVEARYAAEIEARTDADSRRCDAGMTTAQRIDEVVRGPIKSKTVFPALILHLIARQPDHGYGLMQRIRRSAATWLRSTPIRSIRCCAGWKSAASSPRRGSIRQAVATRLCHHAAGRGAAQADQRRDAPVSRFHCGRDYAVTGRAI